MHNDNMPQIWMSKIAKMPLWNYYHITIIQWHLIITQPDKTIEMCQL